MVRLPMTGWPEQLKRSSNRELERIRVDTISKHKDAHLISSVYASSKAAVNRSKRLSDEEIMVCCDRNDIDIAAAGHDGCGSG